MPLWIFLWFFFFGCPNSYLLFKKKNLHLSLRNSIHLFWISWWSGIFTTKGEGDREDDGAEDTCLLLPVTAVAERDSYSLRSFEVSRASRRMMSLLIICVNGGDSLWISWICQGGFNWGRERKDWVAWVPIPNCNPPGAGGSSPGFLSLYKWNNGIYLTRCVGKLIIYCE